MLDLKLVSSEPERVKEAIKKRAYSNEYLEYIDRIVELDSLRKSLQRQVDELRSRKNRLSQEISRLKKEGKDASEPLKEAKSIDDELRDLEKKQKETKEELDRILLLLPNIPDEDVPVGPDESYNLVVKHWGEKPQFDFTPKPHWEVGEKLGILDFKRAAKLSGSRFTVYKGDGARLERALINFMLELHAKRGFTEILPPFLVNTKTMTGTGQLPKFADDLFKVEKHDLWLIPTAEVPLVNLFSGEILSPESLPIYLTAYTPCFRAEAGSYGKDVRGIIRQHQFNKVELVKIVEPEKSEEELESLLEEAELVLQELGLHYRVVKLSTGDLGFSASKTYDIEVWMAGTSEYKEISSVSNTKDFQTRRAGIRWKPAPKAKPVFPHALNGSGLAVGRTVAAILENYQLPDGRVKVPEKLVPYFGKEYIEPANF